MTLEELLKKLREDISWLGYNDTERGIITHIQCAMKYLEKQESINYADCANALLKLWMENVLTDSEYHRISDKLEKAHNKEKI